MNLYQIIQTTTFDDIFAALELLYPEQSKNKEGYQKVFEIIKAYVPPETLPRQKVVIDREESYFNSTYHENETPFSLTGLEWQHVVFCEISTKEELTKEQVASTLLFELTFWGFNEDSSLKMLEELEEDESVEVLTKEAFDEMFEEFLK